MSNYNQLSQKSHEEHREKLLIASYIRVIPAFIVFVVAVILTILRFL